MSEVRDESSQMNKYSMNNLFNVFFISALMFFTKYSFGQHNHMNMEQDSMMTNAYSYKG